ncbi:hypothetical protein LINPERPRIM_LOCUS13272 [Linum perenne]
MATAAAGYHIRSASSPTKPHPLAASVESTLNKLKASESSPLSSKLGILKGIYDAVDDLLQPQSTRLAIFSNRQSQLVEEALNGSLRMLELCSKIRDFFLQMKDMMQELGSSLRRRRKHAAIIRDAASAYLASRKRLTRDVRKLVRCNFQDRGGAVEEGSDSSSTTDVIITILRGVEETTVEVMESLLCYISQQGTASQSSSGGWSLRIIVLALQSKCSHSECQDEKNEMKKLDSLLMKLRGSKDVDFVQVQEAVKGLEELESNMKEMEEEMECIYRRQVKARVSLLNCLTR